MPLNRSHTISNMYISLTEERIILTLMAARYSAFEELRVVVEKKNHKKNHFEYTKKKNFVIDILCKFYVFVKISFQLRG